MKWKFFAIAGYMLLVSGVHALGTPFGYAAGVTGGGSATTQTPSSAAELKSWLEDSVTRRITLNQIYDFTNYYSIDYHFREVCFPYSCTTNVQGMISTSNDFCADYSNKSTSTWYASVYLAHFESSASNQIKVKSNKTLLGSGSNTGINGASLYLDSGVSNVIIQNIKLTNLNARWVWGGDLRIDHNYFNRVGRQFIVTHYDASSVTISHNYFDGTADYSTGCDGYHYWAFLLLGQSDRLTLAYNYIYHTAGRGPHVGGQTTTSDIYAHVYNNYFYTIHGHALDAGSGSYTLMEGNYFNGVTTPKTTNVDGATYWVTSSNVGTCTSSIGRTCQANTLASSGTVSGAADTAVLSKFGAETAVKGVTPMAASAVPSYVVANAGTGKTIT
ncbi:pectate lyase [Flagelloscypha sp. PMI_526]|nr:pectate lyase [Flagelloscypha sp. PMI_526]